MNNIKRIIKNNDAIYYAYLCIKNGFSHKEREKYIEFKKNSDYVKINRYGDLNSDKILFLIDPVKSYTSGFFSNLSMVLYMMFYANQKGFAPVIYKGKDTHYNEKEEYLGVDNYFEYFFEQPAGIPYNLVQESMHVIWSDVRCIDNYYEDIYTFRSDVLIESIKKNLSIKKNIMTELNKAVDTYINDKKVLGVKYRGTDFFNKYKGHAIPLLPEEMIERVKIEYENGYDHIYLATEDENALQLFVKYFGKEIVFDESIKRASEKKMHVDTAKSDPLKHSAFYEGFNVLKDVWVLANANVFLGSQCAVSDFVELFSEGYNINRLDKCSIVENGYYKRGRDSVKQQNKIYKQKYDIH